MYSVASPCIHSQYYSMMTTRNCAVQMLIHDGPILTNCSISMHTATSIGSDKRLEMQSNQDEKAGTYQLDKSIAGNVSTPQCALATILGAIGPSVPALADESILQVKPVLRFPSGSGLEIQISQTHFDGTPFVMRYLNLSVGMSSVVYVKNEKEGSSP